jgi:hypothetical protein
VAGTSTGSGSNADHAHSPMVSVHVQSHPEQFQIHFLVQFLSRFSLPLAVSAGPEILEPTRYVP